MIRRMKQTTTKDASDAVALGTRLRHLRRVRGLRMRDLAQAVGCSESFISKLESGRTRPSLNTLHRIVHALDANMAQLFPADDVPDAVVLRAGERPLIGVAGDGAVGIELERLIPYDPTYLLQGQIHHLAPGAVSEGAIAHQGEEVGYVLEGEVEITIDGKSAALGRGDSFHFRSDRPHCYRNLGRQPAKILWINTPPTY
jgi:transcriptional regulator with XRE-family HTH domain